MVFFNIVILRQSPKIIVIRNIISGMDVLILLTLRLVSL